MRLGRPGNDLLSRDLSRSTIGPGAFHGRVRNGIGCSHSGIITRSAKAHDIFACARRHAYSRVGRRTRSARLQPVYGLGHKLKTGLYAFATQASRSPRRLRSALCAELRFACGGICACCDELRSRQARSDLSRQAINDGRKRLMARAGEAPQKENEHCLMRVIKPIELLVPVSYTRYRASTPGLSTWWSTTTLKGELVLRWVSRLDAFSVYPVHT